MRFLLVGPSPTSREGSVSVVCACDRHGPGGGLASASAQCNWPVVEGWPCRYGRTRSSWLREVMLSLVKTVAQVVLNGTGADEQAAADLRVRQPVTGQRGDLSLLGRQLTPGLDRALADRLT